MLWQLLKPLAPLFRKPRRRTPRARGCPLGLEALGTEPVLPAPVCAAACGCRPEVQALEARLVLSNELAWQPPVGSPLLFGTAANWYDVIDQQPAGRVPGASDYVLFGATWSTAGCTLNGTFGVDRVIMEGDYAGILTAPAGTALAASTEFQQNGALAFTGGTVSAVNGTFYADGSVTATGTGSVLGAGTTLAINTSAFTVTGGDFVGGTPALTLVSDDIDDAGNIAVGAAGVGPGFLGIVGSIKVQPHMVVTLTGVGGTNSEIAFAGTVSGSQFDVQGALEMVGGTVVASGAPVKIDGGTMDCLAGAGHADIVTGNLTETNAGTVNVGSAAGATSELRVIGSLAVNDGTALNLYTTAVLNLGAAPLGSTFTVDGTMSMYGVSVVNAGETSGVPVPLDLTGTLVTYGNGFGAGDAISGSVVNNGTLNWGGGLHMLGVTGAYTQGQFGGLGMRLNNGPTADFFFVGGLVTLDGTLNLTALNALTPTQTWFLLFTATGIAGDFSVINYPPDGNPNWAALPGPVTYLVQN